MAPSLTLLGTGTALPHPQRGPTAGLLQTPDARVLLDCGSGTLQKAAAAGADLFSLDALLLTHVHLDHLADLLPLAFALSIPRIERAAPLQVILSHEALLTWNRLQDALDPWLTPPATNLQLRPLHPGEDLHTLGLHIQSAPVQHHPSSIGWRITLPNRATLAWPGDTGPCDTLPHLVRSATLAVLECGFPDGTPLDGHLTPSAILDAIAENPPDRIAIVHRYPLALHDDTLLPRLQQHAPCPVLAPDDGHTFPLLP